MGAREKLAELEKAASSWWGPALERSCFFLNVKPWKNRRKPGFRPPAAVQPLDRCVVEDLRVLTLAMGQPPTSGTMIAQQKIPLDNAGG
jgi:hypothetical protein